MERYKNKIVKDSDVREFFSKLREDSLGDLLAGKDVHYRYYICFSILAGSGLRASECLILKFSDLYIESLGKTELMILSVTGKGSKMRDVLLPPKLSNLLFDYEKYCLKNYFQSESNMRDSYFIFKTVNSKYAGKYTYKWLYKTLGSLLNKYKLHQFNPHKFRHTYAPKIAGLDSFTASQQLCHSKLDTTRIYLHQVDSDLLLRPIKVIDDIHNFSD